ncbi:thiamine pyrophosphate-dependent enzyme [Herbaspirillum sp. RTI4]|uniref:thiamine pyrophosphate-dependent enzyme n=1 Tax=Herbaspirillum sp. RTI4 TaxID=3048640 RepID=UPI002AB32CF6|nr:thiamine pyrophosphate-dependent enzyme [Herbaspirillum sp. RTI4]MDY7579926.1 thiamine pyrophosphate-dependent enzyme [Herbaspirillum sp. RTI4]MEA9983319.1 thiamine pyrophosphate-dependent enzyme [Herbaspirillum sp. RTI4]
MKHPENTRKSANIDRRDFVKNLIAACPGALVVTGLGSASYDVFAAGDRPENFYLWGAMGGAAAVGLGIALAQPTKTVLVITGDGEQLMGLGVLATIGAQHPSNLNVIVIDNGHFGETGMQRSHTSLGTDMAAVARGCGIENVVAVCQPGDLTALAILINKREGSLLAQVFVHAEELPRALPPRDGVFVKNRFRAALGFTPM